MRAEEIVQLTAKFTRQMQHELVANNKKKGDEWKGLSVGDFMGELDYHMEKLDKAVHGQDTAGIREHTADIAVYALFLAAAAGALR